MSDSNLHSGQKTISHWGWGFAERLPAEAMRLGISQQLAAAMGVKPPAEACVPSVALEAVRLPAPRIAVPAELAAFASAAAETRVRRTYGKGFPDQVRGLYGDFGSAPDFVARPRDEQEIEQVLAWAAKAGAWVVPFGGGTSVVAGVEAQGARERAAGVVCLDLGAMSKVLEVDSRSRAARIQAGALGPALEAQLLPSGVSMRFYPQSFEHSTLGGWVATRAGGHFATLYTHIDDLVESTRMITPTGLWQTRRLAASGAGPAPDRLAVGSEGTLGVITEAWVRVQPRPRWRASTSVKFADFGAAVDAARALAQSGLYPSNCRLLDPTEARINMVAGGGETVLLVAFESADHPLEPWMQRALAIVGGFGGVAGAPTYKDEGERARAGDEAAKWREAFLSGPYLQSALITLGWVVDTFETSCTWDAFAGLHQEITTRVRDALVKECGAGMVSCRFTHVYPDGPAPYYTFFGPARADQSAQIERWQLAKQAAGDAILKAGGTITHHHAVGRLHRPWYEQEVPGAFLRALGAVKKELDPRGIMNPGVLLPPG